jgi:hypothetical protein
MDLRKSLKSGSLDAPGALGGGCDRGGYGGCEECVFTMSDIQMNENRLKKSVPTDEAKLLMHSFQLMTWHASDLTALGLDTCTRRKTRRLKGGGG